MQAYARIQWKINQKAQPKKRKADLRKGIKKKGPLTQTIWAPNHPRSSPGPTSSPPHKGDGERGWPRCGHTGVRPHPHCRLSALTSIGGALMTRICGFAWYLQGIGPQTTLGTGIRGGGEPPLSTPHLEPLHLTPPHLYSFTL